MVRIFRLHVTAGHRLCTHEVPPLPGTTLHDTYSPSPQEAMTSLDPTCAFQSLATQTVSLTGISVGNRFLADPFDD